MSRINLYLRLPISRCLPRPYSTSISTAPAPPLLLKLKEDLKSAMKAKDKNRLNVLRSLLAAHTSASKTSAPLTTDLQLLTLLRKRASTAHQTAKEFAGAGRADLEEKERAEAGILEQYADQVKVMDASTVEAAVRECISEMRESKSKMGMGEIMAKLAGPGGRCEGQVEKGVLAGVVKSVLAE